MLRTLLEVPLVWFAAALAGGWLLLRRSARAPAFAAAAGAGSIALLLLVAAGNVRTAGFLVSFGANVLGIAAAHRNGQALYHAVGGAQLYTLVYGPYTYLVFAPVLGFSDALTAAKFELAAVFALTAGALFLLARRRGQVPWQTALALTGFAAACLLVVPAGVLGIRGDAWGVLALTLALLAVEARKPWLAACAAGACCGFAADLKATLAIEGLLVLALLWHRHGGRAMAPFMVCAAAVAGAPFAFAGVSLGNYLAWLRLSGGRATLPSLLTANILFAVMLLAPALLLARRDQSREPEGPARPPQGDRASAPLFVIPAGNLRFDRTKSQSATETILFTLALLTAIVTGAKSGGGPWHLWPLLPFVLFWTARRLAFAESQQAKDMVAALALAALIVSARWGVRSLRMELPRTTAQARAAERDETTELRSLAGRYAGRPVEMAPGASMQSDAGDLRFVLVAAGEPYQVDMVAAGEALKMMPALPALPITGCGTLWVVPTSEQPFATANNNELRATFPFLFPAELRAAFLARHRVIARGSHYDLWACPPGDADRTQPRPANE